MEKRIRGEYYQQMESIYSYDNENKKCILCLNICCVKYFVNIGNM